MVFLDTDQLTPFETVLNQVVTDANAKVQASTGTVTIVTANVIVTAAVTFPVAYAVAPVVTTSAVTTNTGTKYATPSAVTTTGFTINAINTTTTTNVVYSWIAKG